MATNDTYHSGPQASDQPQAAELPAVEKPIPEGWENAFNGSVISGDKAKDAAKKAEDLTGQALDFLSNASNETLGACIVGIGAATWLVLGRVGLILIGIVVGVVLHATWEGSSLGHADEKAKALDTRGRREKGLDVAARVLDWRERTNDEAHAGALVHQPQKSLDFSEFQKETASALTDLVDAVVRDYVKYVRRSKGFHGCFG